MKNIELSVIESASAIRGASTQFTSTTYTKKSFKSMQEFTPFGTRLAWTRVKTLKAHRGYTLRGFYKIWA